MKKLLFILAALLLAPAGPTWAQTIKSGHVLGNGAGSERTPTDTQLISVINQSGSGINAAVAALLVNAPNASGGMLSYAGYNAAALAALANAPNTTGGFATYPTAGGTSVYYNITSYGCVASTSTGSADQASCVTSAIAAASAAGGGVVWVPAGYWNLKSNITLPANVALQCEENGYYLTSNTPSYGTKQGAIFAVLWGSGSGHSDNPTYTALILRSGTRVSDCGWWYPSQVAGTASTPTEYGATIMVWDGNGNLNQEVGGNHCYNCYSFIDFRGSVGAGVGVAGANVHDNVGAPIFRGISFNFVVDWVTSRDNSFNSGGLSAANPFVSGNLVSWAALNGTAFYYGNGSWVKEIGNQAWGYKQCHGLDGVTFVNSGFTMVGPLEVESPGCDGSYYGFYQNGGTTQSLQITGFHGTTFCQLPLCQSTNWPGSLVALNSGSTMQSLIINGAYVFGPIGYAVYSTSSTITSASIANVHEDNTGTANGWAAFTLGTGTNVSIMGSWTHGFNAVEYCAACTNVTTTGSFNN